MKLLVKIGLLGLLGGATATAVHGDPIGGWLSPNGTSGAAPTSSTTTVTGSGTVSGTASGTVSGTASVSLGATLSLADLQVRVHQLHEQARTDARHIQHLQLMARREKDVIKLNCVNDKLVQVKPQMNIADLGEAELESAHDTDRVAIFDGISQAADNVRRLREEADQCIGEPIGTGGDTSNSFTAPPPPTTPPRASTATPSSPRLRLAVQLIGWPGD